MSAIDAAGVIEARRRMRQRRRALLLVVGLVAAFAATGAFWLAGTGANSLGIGAAPGTSSTGEVLSIETLSSSVTRSNGAAALQIGVSLSKLTIAKDYTANIRVTIAWTNVVDAVSVLNNPNANISIGLYHPIHTGNCSSTENSVDAPLVNVDGFCAALAPSPNQATGSATVSDTGKLLLARNLISGFLRARLAAPASPATCAAGDGSSAQSDTWCQPSGVDSNQRILYLVASIVTPGGIPQGTQTNLSSLTFYVQAKRAA